MKEVFEHRSLRIGTYNMFKILPPKLRVVDLIHTGKGFFSMKTYYGRVRPRRERYQNL